MMDSVTVSRRAEYALEKALRDAETRGELTTAGNPTPVEYCSVTFSASRLTHFPVFYSRSERLYTNDSPVSELRHATNG